MKQKILMISASALVGAIAGYAYYYYFGCASGTCAITSKPINSSLYGALMGGLIGDAIRDMMVKKQLKKSDSEK